MLALLLATGEHHKLRPLTERIPSPMAPVMNRPVMMYNLELLGRLGFKHILVSVHAMTGSIESYFNDGQRWGLTLEYLLQRDALGTAGALRWAKSLLKETFIVMPADQMADLEIEQAIRQHQERQALATVITHAVLPNGTRSVLVDETGMITAIGNPADQPAWADTGIYIFEPQIVDLIPPHQPLDIHQHLLPKLLAKGIPIQTCPLTGYWNPLDTIQSYAEAQKYAFQKALNPDPVVEGKITYRYVPLEWRQISRGIWTGRNNQIHPEARLFPPIVIGHNCMIGREVELGPGVSIGSNVVIDQGASIQDSSVLDNTYVGKLVHLEDRLVNQDHLIDLNTGEDVLVTDSILLGKASPQAVADRLKRPLEFILALLLLLLSLPMTLVVGIVLFLTTGQVFKRTPCLSVRASTLKDVPGMQENFDLLHFNTTKADGQPSKFGRWLESWEGQRLPELLNVLKGDLALIGLKPVLTEAEKQLRADWMLEQNEVAAGFSGLWYVQTEADSQPEEFLVADAYYLNTHSLAQDIQILFRTLPAWLRKQQAKAVPQIRSAGV